MTDVDREKLTLTELLTDPELYRQLRKAAANLPKHVNTLDRRAVSGDGHAVQTLVRILFLYARLKDPKIDEILESVLTSPAVPLPRASKGTAPPS